MLGLNESWVILASILFLWTSSSSWEKISESEQDSCRFNFCIWKTRGSLCWRLTFLYFWCRVSSAVCFVSFGRPLTDTGFYRSVNLSLSKLFYVFMILAFVIDLFLAEIVSSSLLRALKVFIVGDALPPSFSLLKFGEIWAEWAWENFIGSDILCHWSFFMSGWQLLL